MFVLFGSESVEKGFWILLTGIGVTEAWAGFRAARRKMTLNQMLGIHFAFLCVLIFVLVTVLQTSASRVLAIGPLALEFLLVLGTWFSRSYRRWMIAYPYGLRAEESESQGPDHGGIVVSIDEDVTCQRLDDQIGWYDKRSIYSQRMYKGLKITEVVVGALIAFLAGLSAPAWITGGAGVLIVVLEGLQHINQYHERWASYRSTSEALKHEKFLSAAGAGPYSTATKPHMLLAERVESLISREHAQWVSAQEEKRSDRTAAPGAQA
jgi:uncharacterized membrane protein (UPF0136 family)